MIIRFTLLFVCKAFFFLSRWYFMAWWRRCNFYSRWKVSLKCYKWKILTTLWKARHRMAVNPAWIGDQGGPVAFSVSIVVTRRFTARQRNAVTQKSFPKGVTGSLSPASSSAVRSAGRDLSASYTRLLPTIMLTAAVQVRCSWLQHKITIR